MNTPIPEEIVIQIFTWLPVKSLMRFKCVAKFFNSLVSESYFTEIHTSHSMIHQGGTKYFLNGTEFYCIADQEKEYGKSSASRLVQIRSSVEFPFYIPVGSNISCVNGLFCIQKPPAILNPSTGEVRYLPKINDDRSLLYYWLGFEPEENKYKVLLTRDGSGLYIKQCVFALGIDISWRKTQSISRCVSYKPGVCINGVIYRFVFHGGTLAIDAFDLKTESFKLIALKNSSNWWYYELIEVRGKLAIINCPKWSCEFFNLRVLRQIQKEQEEWESHIIHYPSMWKHIPPKIIPHVILSCMFCDGQILFILNLESGDLWSRYDIRRQSWRKLEIKGLPTNHRITGIYSYRERLVM
ncbi:F-box protein DOR-like [Solanum pennellii]|uniref:F-box protein DOR-like n=1 Tax=Solanum pennellii TaxID=28526 RepID=A0ABM1V1Z3_SOLPN|nr:F-box protein DOR-like [Solanum pennellii]